MLSSRPSMANAAHRLKVPDWRTVPHAIETIATANQSSLNVVHFHVLPTHVLPARRAVLASAPNFCATYPSILAG